jgi:DNA-directed RNA polymerase specialized sigma24 family protein
MNVHFTYRFHKTPAAERDIQHQIERLRKRLRVFRPDLIHLKGMVEELSTREGVGVSLNLRLPSGQMAAKEEAPTAVAAVKAAFEDLLLQVNKHKEHLRSTHKWTPRQTDELGRHSVRRNSSVPFEETVAAVSPEKISADDVRSYVNANLARLERFVEREIYFRETAGQIVRNSISKEEVIDETIAAALGGGGDEPVREQPERLALEPWLYRLALDALNLLSRPDVLSQPDETNVTVAHMEGSPRRAMARAGDDSAAQFLEPDEPVGEETVIADERAATPEQIVGSDEMMRLIASALRDVSSDHREAFILHAIEGFDIDEISAITGVPPEQVFESISAARDHLRKSPQVAGQFKVPFVSSGIA